MRTSSFLEPRHQSIATDGANNSWTTEPARSDARKFLDYYIEELREQIRGGKPKR